MSGSALRNFVVTTQSSDGIARSQIWDASRPLTLGYPLEWIVERTERGVRVRSVSIRPGEIRDQGAREVPNAQLDTGAEIELPRAGDRGKLRLVSLNIRPARRLDPVFDAAPADPAQAPTMARIFIFACSGPWISECHQIRERFTARHGGKPAFVVQRVADSFEFRFLIDRFELVGRGGARTSVARGETRKLELLELAGTHVVWNKAREWRFGLHREAALPPPSPLDAIDPETEWFKKSLKRSMIGLGLFLILAFVWPKPPMETKPELVPPQFAKLVLTKPKPAPAQAPSGEATPQRKNDATPTKVQQAAVVQAFRAKALKNAISGLLKGGMTRLLQQSDLIGGENASKQARKIFDTRSSALTAEAPSVGRELHGVQVASIGGEGAGGDHAGGKNVGYGKGEHAKVKGQGDTFVSMDDSTAAVEDGLSKDEVGAVIHKHLSEIRYCYESAMLRTPDLEGKLLMNFTIGGTGTVKSSEVKQSTLPDPRLDDCVLRRLVTWKFPSPKGGVDVAVTYPFIFKTLGR